MESRGKEEVAVLDAEGRRDATSTTRAAANEVFGRGRPLEDAATTSRIAEDERADLGEGASKVTSSPFSIEFRGF